MLQAVNAYGAAAGKTMPSEQLSLWFRDSTAGRWEPERTKARATSGSGVEDGSGGMARAVHSYQEGTSSTPQVQPASRPLDSLSIRTQTQTLQERLH
jgi:hypothetical protein